ncbi:hypothetical protein NYE54_09325 [Paenibacillus sp. FSL K6-1330]|uniref:hypothetical protein n=1 Tax=Paenibacillus sp. FSL K6-1330 TaxID=2975292 RepID=UPI0030DB48A5
MKTMYPAQVNSPGTELAAAIDAAQDTIQVADGSVLPDGPNLLTIGTDEAAETILYTDKTGDEMTGITRGFQGTAQSWAVGTKVARYFTAYDHDAAIGNISELSTGLTAARDRLDTVQRQGVVLNAGMQILNAQRRAAFSLSGIKGRTLVNLLGRDGGFEVIGNWMQNGAYISLDSVNYLYGSKSLKVESAGHEAWGGSTWIPLTLDKSKYYVVLVDVKNINSSGGSAMVSIGGVTNKNGNPVSTKDRFSPSCILISPNDMTNATTSSLHAMVSGSSGQSAYFDGYRIYEITAAEYTALSGMTPEQIAAKYPYVDSVQPVRNPYAIRYGENLLPPFYEASFKTKESDIIGPYTYVQTAESTNAWTRLPVTVLPQTDYTLSFSTLNGKGKLAVFSADEQTILLNYGQGARTFNSGNVTQLVIYVSGLADTVDTIINPMLNVGRTAKSFKPREDSMLALQTDLYADPLTGANADEVFEKDGQYFKLAKWKKVTLNGSLNWTLFDAQTGSKRLFLSISGGVTSSNTVVKFDGSVLKNNVDTYSIPDSAALNSSGLFLNVKNSDSGWGDNYTPTADEIKAYFMGWRMYNDDAGQAGEPYNGTGTKVWNSIPGWGTPTYYTGTLPTTLAVDWTPYQLVYQLATPTVEPIVSEGMLTFNEGDNLIEVGTGIVVRESVKPVADPYSQHQINAGWAGGESSRLKNKVSQILSIFRNGRDDYSWLTDPIDAYGKVRKIIKDANYDPSAVYSVTYLMLDKFPVMPITGSYAANEKAMLQELTDAVQQNATSVSVLMNKKVDKDAPAVQITPTLLNGWVEYQDGYHPVRYYKDSSGVVHLTGLVKSGAVSSILFKLASGFRPNSSLMFAAHASINSTVRIDVYKNGEIFFNYVGQWDANAWVSLDGIMFLAEQ